MGMSWRHVMDTQGCVAWRNDVGSRELEGQGVVDVAA